MSARAQLELTAVDRTKQAFDSANRNLQTIGEKIQSITPALDGLGAAIGRGFGPAAIGTAVAGVMALARAQADAIDQFNDLKDATGASIENLSALDDVARRNGATLETVGGALVKFNNTLKEGDKAGVLKALGLDVERLKKLDPAEALRETAVAFSEFADDGNKARAVQALFGKSVREMAPFLKDLSEQQRLNAKVTTGQAEAAEKFNKQLFTMQTELNTVGRSVALPVITAMNDLAEKFKNARTEGSSLLDIILQFSPNALGLRMLGFGKRTSLSAEIDTQRRALEDPTLKPGERSSMEAKLASLIAQRDARNAAWAGEVTEADGDSGRLRLRGKSSIKLPDPKDPTSTPAYKEAMRVAEERQKFRLGEEKAIADHFNELRGFEHKLHEETQKRYAETINEAAKVLGDIWDEEQQSIVRFAEKMKGREGVMDAELDRLSGRTAARNDAALRARISERAASGAMTPDESAKAIKELDEATKKAGDSAREFGGAFTSALDDVLFRAQNVGDVFKGLAINVASIGIQQAITQPAGAAFGKWLTGALSYDGGGYTGGAVRSGGLDGKGGFLAMLHPQETVVDHTKGQQVVGGGGRPVVINISQTVGDVATLSQLHKSNQALKADLLNSLRRSQIYG